ncbi:MAG: MFS transporter, partial [Verrucomicrobia bacterium]|nr:MFS transporter [Cytophagales bacterium]
LGFIFGPPLGGIVKHRFGIEYVGYVVAGLCLLNLIMAYFLLPESLKEKKTTVKFQLNLIEEFSTVLTKPLVKEIFWFGLVYVVAFAMMQTTLALMWKTHYGMTDEQNSYAFAFMGLMAAVVQGGMIGWLNRTFGEKQLLVFGTLIFIIGLVLLPLVPKNLFVPVELFAIALVALANGCLTPTLLSILSKNTPDHEQGQVLGLNQSFNSLARAIGPTIAGALYDFHYFMPYMAGAALMLICWYLAVWIGKEVKLATSEPIT